MPEDTRAVCINLGAGNAIYKSDGKIKWVNLDMYDNPGVDVVHNLEDGLPFENESADLILASHVLEHIRSWTRLMAECYRVLKPKGILAIKVPEARCRAAIADPTHVNLFVPETWNHFDKGCAIGFDTLGMRNMGFILKWNEVLTHYRIGIDDGVPGNYFTEMIVEFEKEGEEYPWESIINKKQEAA